VPSKQSIGCHQRLDLIEYFAAKDFGFHGQSPPLFISKLKPLSFKLILVVAGLKARLFAAVLVKYSPISVIGWSIRQ
jgi:hypothetical protein